jgi:hypothetical protein
MEIRSHARGDGRRTTPAFERLRALFSVLSVFLVVPPERRCEGNRLGFRLPFDMTILVN